MALLRQVEQFSESLVPLSLDALIASIARSLNTEQYTLISNELAKLAICSPSILWQRLKRLDQKGQLPSTAEFLRIFNITKTFTAQIISSTETSENGFLSEIEKLHKSYKHRKNTLEFREDDERARQARISSHLRGLVDQNKFNSQNSLGLSQSSIVSETQSWR